MMEWNVRAIDGAGENAEIKNDGEDIALFPGITLSFLTLDEGNFSVRHESLEHVLEINYCRSGHICWKLNCGQCVYLGPGDIALHTMQFCSDSVVSLPQGHYEGIVLCVDLHRLTENPPELLSDTGITGEMLFEKFCTRRPFTSFAGDHAMAEIFEGFYDSSDAFCIARRRLKALEVLLHLAKLTPPQDSCLNEHRAEQVRTVRSVHSYLMEHLDRRFTIEELSKEYLMNPTTLKEVFKSVYGTSIAAHIKEHRIEAAAQLLRDGELSLSEVAARVGYTNQSKFTAAFKEHYGVLPKEYRKQSATLPTQESESE